MNELTQIKSLIREFLLTNIQDKQLKDCDNIFELGYVNSLFALQLVALIEQTFELVIVDEELDTENFKSIDAMGSFVYNKKQAALA